jgi:hypothetical protein
VAIENIKGQSIVRLGDLYSVRMKLVQYAIQTSREIIRQIGDKIQRTVRDSLSRNSMCELLKSTATVIDASDTSNQQI